MSTPRRTQAERSAETTTKLLDAASACLVDLGWAGTSTNEVCRRAGVSRGALLHHYPTKLELISAAIAHITDRRIEEFRVTLSTLPPDTDVVARLETAIDVLAGIYQSPTIDAWFELVMAARTDLSLQPVLTETYARLQAGIDGTWRELFPPDGSFAPGFYELAPQFLFTLLDGLAIHRLSSSRDAAAHAESIVFTTKILVRTVAGTDPTVIADHANDILKES